MCELENNRNKALVKKITLSIIQELFFRSNNELNINRKELIIKNRINKKRKSV